MKAIILAAGINFRRVPNSRPKCLYHVAGEILLERTVQILRQLGVNDIRIVVGWKREEIEKFNKEKKLGLEFVYNPDWSSNAVKSLTTGLQGVDDDVLIIGADLLIRLDVIEGLLRCDAPFCCIRERPSVSQVYPWGVGTQAYICKVSRERLHVLRGAQKYAERWADKKWGGDHKGWRSESGMAWIGAIIEIFKEFKHEIGGATAARVSDIDFYEQTDEGRGMDFEKRT